MIELKAISKSFLSDNICTEALKNINLNINKGDFIAIMGVSGSGKTTLLSILGCMECPSSGRYLLDGEEIRFHNRKEIEKTRKARYSFIFQNFALMEKYTAYENIEMPLIYKRVSKRKRKEKIYEVANKLGIEDQLHKLPKQMSGGQQQRVAIARALVSGADILLADEPTGALDNKTSMEMMELFGKLNKEGKTIVLVTHDQSVAAYATRIINLVDGGITDEKN